ncbi:ABC transporter permease [Mycoplasma phocimorsus]|uniref:ABC transporter permease subunit n=1 Tax=Mycoplasma phocimorsus TaxID=3045839 RepID=A0AAJ1UWQ3_9MOLU|nr:ABC transporter permease subunit [Mycoplasma phocimorsus]MDJ1645882.1 ABC transporter permease subunit [Mycoplasma phocimorsus]MDJ1646393.1 ABC transporter permease subunit [Mycoplasma phocimorsus]MDJ1647048.1 ABC transporter permease subunit [Mycoplasma phocimorsus]MDJ1647489.1 ABC transporter permease subunit [Mycoplasma phocimorsus]MDJ1647972.1 ABC transporter permease subunit [Mycoplasma phocimorsus]
MKEKIKSIFQFNLRASLLIPYLIIAILFIVLPIILIIVEAFSNNSANSSSLTIVTEWKTWVIIQRSIILGISTCIISLIIAFPFAYIIATSKNKIFTTLTMCLIISPLLIFTIAKIFAIRGLFLTFLYNDSNTNAMWFMIVGLVYLNLPFMIMPLYVVLKDMPRNIVEASQDLGYSKFRTMFNVVIPYCFKAIISGITLVFISSATSIVISDKLVSNPNALKTVGNLINQYANPGIKLDLSIASTLVILITLVIFGISIILYLIPKLISKFRGRRYE